IAGGGRPTARSTAGGTETCQLPCALASSHFSDAHSPTWDRRRLTAVRTAGRGPRPACQIVGGAPHRRKQAEGQRPERHHHVDHTVTAKLIGGPKRAASERILHRSDRLRL